MLFYHNNPIKSTVFNKTIRFSQYNGIIVVVIPNLSKGTPFDKGEGIL